MKNMIQGSSTSVRGMDASQQAEATLNRVSELQKVRERRKSNILEKIAKQQADIATLNNRLNDVNKQLREAHSTIESERSISSDKLETVRQEHQAEIARYRATAAQLYQQIEEANSEISNQRSLMSEAEEKMTEAEDKIAEADEKMKGMEQRISDIEDEAENRVQRSIDEAQRLIHKNRQRFEVKEKRLLASIRSEQDSAALVKEDADNRVAKMTDLLEKERSRCSSLEEDKECMRHENERLGALLRRLQNTVDSLLNDEINLASEYEEVHRDLQDVTDETNAQHSGTMTFLAKDNVASREEVTSVAKVEEK